MGEFKKKYESASLKENKNIAKFLVLLYNIGREVEKGGVIMLVKKNIVIDNEIWAKLRLLSKINNGLSISEIIRQAIDKFLESKKKDLDFQLKLQCAYVDDAEQLDIEESLAELSKEDLAVVRKCRL